MFYRIILFVEGESSFVSFKWKCMSEGINNLHQTRIKFESSCFRELYACDGTMNVIVLA